MPFLHKIFSIRDIGDQTGMFFSYYGLVCLRLSEIYVSKVFSNDWSPNLHMNVHHVLNFLMFLVKFQVLWQSVAA